MKVEFLNPFVMAGVQVLSAEAGLTNWTLEKPQLIRLDATRHARNVVVPVTGVVRGFVVYGMDLAVAKRLVRTMTGIASKVTDEMAESVLGELGNLITGAASGALENGGYPCRIAPPMLVKGTAVRLTHHTVHMVSVPLMTEIGPIHIYLALEEADSVSGQQSRSMKGERI